MERQVVFRRKKRAECCVQADIDDATMVTAIMMAIGVTQSADVLGPLGCRGSCVFGAAAAAGGTHMLHVCVNLTWNEWRDECAFISGSFDTLQPLYDVSVTANSMFGYTLGREFIDVGVRQIITKMKIVMILSMVVAVIVISGVGGVCNVDVCKCDMMTMIMAVVRQ